MLKRAAEPPLPTAIERTLLVPLLARAAGAWLPPPLGHDDPGARRLLDAVLEQASPGTLPAVDPWTALNVVWRSGCFLAAARAFFAEHPRALGINLGCGLSCYFDHLDNGHNHWLDADLPPVMHWREQLSARPDHGRQHALTLDLSHGDWWAAVEPLRVAVARSLAQSADAAPLFVMCEGLLMYLAPDRVRALLQTIAREAPAGSRLVFDAIADWGVGQARWHPTLGDSGVQFLWGVREPDALARPMPGWRLLETRSVGECYPWAFALAERWAQPWLGAPAYAVYTLGR